MTMESQMAVYSDHVIQSPPGKAVAATPARWWQPFVSMRRLWKWLHPQRVFFYHEEKSQYRALVARQRQQARGMYGP
jgi:hypothetical protein